MSAETARKLESIMLAAPSVFPDVEVVTAVARREHGGYALTLTVDREGGVDTDLCERLSRFVVTRVERELPALGNYSLEVASAGLDRPLRKPADFARFIGRDVRIITRLQIANRVEFTGTIEAWDDVKLTVADRYAGRVEIPYEAVKRANLVYEARDDLKKKA